MEMENQSNRFTVATYNIRLDTFMDEQDQWVNRKENIKTLIVNSEWDVLGLQEAKQNQLDDLKELADYQFVGLGRSDDENNEYNPIAFKPARFALIESGTFWLSITPDIPSQAFEWQADCPRICTWVHLKQKSNDKEFFFFNTHFDHISEEARFQSALLIKKEIDNLAKKKPVFLTGDFNADEKERWYDVIATKLKNVMINSPHHVGPLVTCTGVGFSHDSLWDTMQHIDYIFTTHDVSIYSTCTLTDKFAGRYPSDHFPVSAVCSLNEEPID